MAQPPNDTYKYWFKVDHVKVHMGITNNLEEIELQHLHSGQCSIYEGRHYHWKNGRIVQVGEATTKEVAMHWERENGCNYGWN
jgi:hypothetical protein